MAVKLYFIRHGKTAGNTEKRYVGCTDEPIREDEKTRLNELRRHFQRTDSLYGEALRVKRVVASPLKRCLDTAACLWPSTVPEICQDLREMNFGDYEYMNYEELKEKAGYQHFLDTMGESGFPGGESMGEFAARCRRAFDILLPALTEDTAFAVHGGTIMALFYVYAKPSRPYYDWYSENGEGFAASLDVDENGAAHLTAIEKIAASECTV